MKISLIPILVMVFLAALILSSCKKDRFITSPSAIVTTNADTLSFDTVFTSVGSITQIFKIYNGNSQKILLSKVKLMGGSSSSYRININGIPSSEADGVELAANDSMYVFVTVNINPSAANLPFIVQDSILIQYNGNNKFVQLQAFGQNAHFFTNKVVHANEHWTNDLPYVILGSLQVDTPAMLTLDAGCRIHVHANAPILVDGTLIVNGTKADSVVFTGDRLDIDYRDLPASWPGIYFRGQSKDNVLTHAFVRNADRGLVVTGPSINAQPKLVLNKCVVSNCYKTGIEAFNSSIAATNCLIINNANDISTQFGGNYDFVHCTVTAYSNDYINHQNPCLSISNAATLSGVTQTNDLHANFINCIIWGDGSLNDEIAVDKEGANVFSLAFDHCLYKMSAPPANSTNTSNLINLDPKFDSVNASRNYYDFHITKDLTAPVLDAGVDHGVTSDLDDQLRPVGLLPDMGCYEKQ